MLVNLIDYYSGNFLPSCVFYKKEGCHSIAGFIDAKSDPAEVLWALNRYQQNIRDRQAKVRRRKRDAVVRNKMCSVPQTPANLKRWADKHIMPHYRNPTMGTLVTMYVDYLHMCRRQAYDMKDKSVLFPKNCTAAHNREAERIQKINDAQKNKAFCMAYI